MLAARAIRPDPRQAAAVEALARLEGDLASHGAGWFGRPRGQRGLYLWGPVGRGKSMLMDLFFAAAQLTRKRRIHFHHFMQEAHARIHRWRRENPDGDDPIPPLAAEIADEAALLCFDEFQINDIADAILLGRLFEALFARGVVVVATSNTVPDDLFKGRPGRDAFLPFIAMIKKHLDVIVLDGARDYRRNRLHLLPTWIVPADSRAQAVLDRAFCVLSGDAPAAPTYLTVLGRRVDVLLAAEGVARFDFETLCGRPLGPGDYLALAVHFHTLVLDRIPILEADNYDRARRFIILVDALYDHRVKLVASAAAPPDALYPCGDGAAAFTRTASRLIEMQSPEYRELAHLT